VDLIGGVYLFDEDWQTDRRGNTGTYPSNNAQIVYTPVDTQITQINTHMDLYGEAKIHFTPQLTGTIGLRGDYQTHSNDQQMYTLLTNGKAPWTLASGGVPDVNTILFAPRGNLIWSTPGTIRTDYFTPLPKGVLEYAVNPDLKPYVSVSQGQKDGGYDFRAILPTAEEQALLPYRPENLTTVEVGLKSKFLDDRLEFDTAAFYNYFADLQNTFLDPTTNLSHRYNIGDAHSVGLEAELSGHITPAWNVNLSATLLDAVLNSYNGVVHSVTYPNGFTEYTTPFPGAQLPYSPHAQGNIGTSYVLPLTIPGTLRIFGNAELSTSYYGDLTNITQQKIPSSAVLNGGVDWTSQNGRWNVSLTVRNLTDQRYPASVSYVVYSSGPNAGKPVFVSTAWDDPLTAFLQVKLSL
jgi:iron complex outermembrane receptor protein